MGQDRSSAELRELQQAAGKGHAPGPSCSSEVKISCSRSGVPSENSSPYTCVKLEHAQFI